MKKIARQVINGESYDPSKNYDGIDTSNPYLVYNESEGVPIGYEDVTTSLVNISSFYAPANADYVTMRQMSKDFVSNSGGFNSLSEDDKFIAVETIAIDENNQSELGAVIGFILINDVSPVDPLNPTSQEMLTAQSLYIEYKSEQIELSSEAFRSRVYSEVGSLNKELISLALKHVPNVELFSLMENVKAFLFSFTSMAWTGKVYGDYDTGLSDYINDNDIYAGNQGLGSFSTMAPQGATPQEVEAYRLARRQAFDNYLFK